jgi:hypothetical protein
MVSADAAAGAPTGPAERADRLAERQPGGIMDR